MARSSVSVGVKPWHRVLAAVVVVGCVVAAVFIMLDVYPERTSWSKHVLGAVVVLVLPGGLALSVVAPRVASRLGLLLGWTLPAALIWIGVEHWLHWFAFYETTGRSRITSETGARVRGGFLVLIGLAVFGIYLSALRSHRGRQRRTR